MEEEKNEDDKSIDSEIEELEEGSTKKKRLMPKKSHHRMRAHINPLSDTPFPYPLNPDYANWSLHYPLFFEGNAEDNKKIYTNTDDYPLSYPSKVDDKFNGKLGARVEFADVGCGFGGLLFALSKKFPENLAVGMEIRDKVVNYVGEKIRALRIEHPGQYGNIAVLRTNAMRHICSYFRKGQMTKLFFCFADPHFKRSNFRRRIINPGLVAEYCYLLKQGGKIYSITDVEDLHIWNVEHLNGNPLLKKIPESEHDKDVCVDIIMNETEEGKKVTRNNGKKFVAVYERI
jgi:tRNA (guanine-N7-)-methyltransferase